MMDTKGVRRFINEEMGLEFSLKRSRDRSFEAESIESRESERERLFKAPLDKAFGVSASDSIEVVTDPEFVPKGVKISGFGRQ